MPTVTPSGELYIGLMSGTSIDGVDAALARFDDAGHLLSTLASESLPMPDELRDVLTALQAPSPNELAVAAQAGNRLADLYADCVARLLVRAGVSGSDVVALGAHGQTIRHDPAAGYTIQILNGARLAARTGIATVADVRSADIAAGGQGAPLVPAFHARVFAAPRRRRGILNIGGIANLTVLSAAGDQLVMPVIGFDTGPGNTLLDGWCESHLGSRFDDQGRWAASGRSHPALLASMRAEPYFSLPAPKSTGRDLFNPVWLAHHGTDHLDPADVQASLLELTASTIADAIAAHGLEEVFVCGGGAANSTLMARIQQLIGDAVPLASTTTLGLDPQAVEATAFAWFARQRIHAETANLPSVTGASSACVLGALHHAGVRQMPSSPGST